MQEKEAKEKKPKIEKKPKAPVPASERIKFGPGTIIPQAAKKIMEELNKRLGY